MWKTLLLAGCAAVGSVATLEVVDRVLHGFQKSGATPSAEPVAGSDGEVPKVAEAEAEPVAPPQAEDAQSVPAIEIAAAGPVADIIQEFTFENSFGVQVVCTVQQHGEIETRAITAVYLRSTRVDRAPTAEAWTSSGCEEFVRRQTTPITREEQIRMMEAARREYFPTAEEREARWDNLMERATRLVCAKPEEANNPRCQ